MTGIRRATVAAAAALATLHAAGGADRPWSAAEYSALLARPDVIAWTAMADGRPAGFLVAAIAADEAEIYEVVVTPRHRRRGLGRALIAALAAHAKSLALTKIHLEVAENNLPARALYEGSCFRTVGRRREYYKYSDGTTADALLMTLAV